MIITLRPFSNKRRGVDESNWLVNEHQKQIVSLDDKKGLLHITYKKRVQISQGCVGKLLSAKYRAFHMHIHGSKFLPAEKWNRLKTDILLVWGSYHTTDVQQCPAECSESAFWKISVECIYRKRWKAEPNSVFQKKKSQFHLIPSIKSIVRDSQYQ